MALLRRIPAWRPGAYARDSLRIFGWLLLRTAAQAAIVLLLARWLGAEGYGAFVTALAVASFFTPLAGLGLGGVLLVRGARDPAGLAALEGKAIRLWGVSSSLCTVLATLAMFVGLPGRLPLWALAALAAAEVVAASWVELKARIAQAQLQAHRFGALQAGLPLTRLFALVPAMALLPATPSAWMIAYALASLLYAVTLAVRGRARPARSVAPEATAAAHPPPLVREGLPFAGGAVAVRLQAEFNKPVLAQIGYAEAGALNVAQRIVDLVALPLAALQEALWPRVLSAAQPNQRLWQTGMLLVLFALAGGGLMALAAPLVVWLLGEDYGQTAQALVWLAGLPALQVLRNLGNVAILAQQRHHRLLLVYATAAISGVVLTLLWVPNHGVAGAVWAMYGSEGLAAAVAWSSRRQIAAKRNKGSA